MRMSLTTIVAAMVGAVALSCLLIPSDRRVAVACAQGQSMDQQTEVAAIDRTMRSYHDAFSHSDAAASAQQFSAPSTFMTPQGAASRASIAQIETSFAATIRDLKEQGYSHSSWLGSHAKLLGRHGLILLIPGCDY
jgi:hypothetical protein